MGPKDKNFHLNERELEFLNDPSFFERKREITERIVMLLGTTEHTLERHLHTFTDVIPVPAMIRRGKITRGENYLGLPYLLLDYPSCFGRDGVFAIRTLVWWAHPVILTFHISGKYFGMLKERITTNHLKSLPQHYLVCINEREWEHHTDKNNYITLERLHTGDQLPQLFAKSFLKLAYEVPLHELPTLEDKCSDFLKTILTFCSIRNQ